MSKAAISIPTSDWTVGANEKGLMEAVWKRENEYLIREQSDGRWSLIEAGETLGTFGSALEAANEMPELELNPWEDIDGQDRNFYLKLAPTSFDEWVSGETGDVFLRGENGSWWLSYPNQTGQSQFPTRLQGMIAGLAVYSASYEAQDRLVIASLGLDESDWSVAIDGGNIIASHKHDENVSLQATDNSTEWSLFNGDEIVGEFRSAKDGAASLVSMKSSI
jgi:hypothetical protein